MVGIATTTLKVDFDGNGTEDTIIATNEGKDTIYDVTPPELKITFSTSTKDVTLSAVDNLDLIPKLNISTSSIKIIDSQSNTTTIPLAKFKDQSTKLKLVFNQVVRNGIATTTLNTYILYDWKLDNQSNLKDLDTKVVIKGIEKYIFNYKKNANQTTIKTKDIQTNQVTTMTRTGFVPVTIITDKDNLLDISY